MSVIPSSDYSPLNFRDLWEILRLPVLLALIAIAATWLVWYFTSMSCPPELAETTGCNPAQVAQHINLDVLNKMMTHAVIAGGGGGLWSYAVITRERRAREAAERELAAERERAAAEREKAAEEREKAAEEREKAAEERQRFAELLAEQRQQADDRVAEERQKAEEQRQQADDRVAEERQRAEEQRQQADDRVAEERQKAEEQRREFLALIARLTERQNGSNGPAAQ